MSRGLAQVGLAGPQQAIQGPQQGPQQGLGGIVQQIQARQGVAAAPQAPGIPPTNNFIGSASGFTDPTGRVPPPQQGFAPAPQLQSLQGLQDPRFQGRVAGFGPKFGGLLG